MTKNFTLEELTESATARRKGIDNSPSEEVTGNLERLAKEILQPVRDRIGVPVIVNSGYRSKALNKAVNGSPTSQHITGSAADIRIAPTPGESPLKANFRLFCHIKEMIESGEITVGQLIDEYDYSWVHVSLPSAKRLNDIRHLK